MFYSPLWANAILLMLSANATYAVKTFSLDVYKEVAYAGFPVFFDKRLYLADLSDQVVRVYNIDKGLESPVFLWATPGNGQGPGEIPGSSNQAINGLSIEPKSRDLWISHRQGLLIFDEQGNLKKQIKRAFNQACVLPLEDGIFFTSKNLLRDRSAITQVGEDLTTVRWQVDCPHKIPITEQGAYLNPRPELHQFDGLFYHFDPSWGALLCVDSAGNERYFTKFPLLRVPILTISHFDAFQPGKEFALSQGPDPRSGMIQDPENENQFWVIVPHRSEAIRLEKGETLHFELDEYTEFRVFLCFDRRTGTQIARYLQRELFRKTSPWFAYGKGSSCFSTRTKATLFTWLIPRV